MNANRIIGIIPARYGSSRFPGKMLATIAGKPLIQHTWEKAKGFACIDDLVVATDDQRIYDCIDQLGGQVVMTSVSCPSGTDRLAEVVRDHPRFRETDIIVNIQGDDPFINEATIQHAASHLLADKEAVMGTAVCPLTCPSLAADPSVVKCVLDLQGNALYFSRSLIPGGHSLQALPSHTYYHHIGLYLFRPDFLLKYGTLPPTPLQLAEDLEQLKVIEHGYRIRAAVVPPLNGVHINTQEDLIKAEAYLCPQNSFSSPAASALR